MERSKLLLLPLNFSITPSKALFYFCISFTLGVFLESIVYRWGLEELFSGWLLNRVQVMVLGFLVFGILIIFIAFLLARPVRFNVSVVGFCMLFLALGITRLQIIEFTIENDQIRKLNDRLEKITFVGQVIHEPDVRNSIQKLKVHLAKFTVGDVLLKAKQFNWVNIKDAHSVILVTLNRHVDYHYLDTVKVTGQLKTPIVTEDFNYKNYLLKDGIYSVMDFPKTELISDKHQYNVFNFLYEKILFLKGKLMKSIDMNFSSSHSVILQGIVFGNDKNMPRDVKDKFNATGLSHITAVSGSNIVMLISILMVVLLALGFWRAQAFYGTVAFIWIYIILIGFPVSGIRAVIMGSVALLAQKLGRQNSSGRVIMLTAAVMLFLNPMLLLYDVSFQLSFLASLGIIYLKPLIDYFISFTTNKKASDSNKWKLKTLSDIISVTFSAQIFTLPIIAYNFGSISLIAPITNLLVLPFIPLLTMLGFLVSIFGIFSNFLAWVFYLPCWLLLTYLLKVIEIFYQPWAVKTVQHVSWIWLVVYYVILGFLIWFLDKKQKPKFLGY